jgi:hypothetical protein
MALDGANFIAELSITDPPGSDPLSQGDDQIRTIKRATFQSFPLIAAAVNITDAQMNLMAVKNEANVFTADQTIKDNDLVLDAAADVGLSIAYQRSGLLRWSLTAVADAGNQDWSLTRFDDLGDFIDLPITADRATGVVNFSKVPTVQGDPLWIVGEVKMIVQGASLPSNNWFPCNGLLGTVDLRDRIMGAQGVFTGTQSPFLDAQTDAGNAGTTALSAAQMPSHRHRVAEKSLSGGQVQANPATVLAAGQGLAGVILSTGTVSYADQTDTRAIVENTGGGGTHTHDVGGLEVNPASNDAFQVMPFTYFMQAIQYVP